MPRMIASRGSRWTADRSAFASFPSRPPPIFPRFPSLHIRCLRSQSVAITQRQKGDSDEPASRASIETRPLVGWLTGARRLVGPSFGIDALLWADAEPYGYPADTAVRHQRPRASRWTRMTPPPSHDHTCEGCALQEARDGRVCPSARDDYGLPDVEAQLGAAVCTGPGAAA